MPPLNVLQSAAVINVKSVLQKTPLLTKKRKEREREREREREIYQRKMLKNTSAYKQVLQNKSLSLSFSKITLAHKQMHFTNTKVPAQEVMDETWQRKKKKNKSAS